MTTPRHSSAGRPPAESGTQLRLSFEASPAAHEPVAVRRIWAVGELVSEVRLNVERAYADMWVEGEISNLRPAASGHIYFTLKDGEAQLPVVLFRRQASLLRFRPQDGLAVLVRGKVSVYEQRGQMQLIAEWLEPMGAGSLQIAFEQLKARLAGLGYFDAERKKALPAFPRCVGIVTSPAGAVIRDFLNVAGRRHAALDVLLYPALVQGEGAAAEIAAGIAHFNATRTVDLIVIARGGGSLEDLAPFNTEMVADAIAASELPVVSAVGHETDFTIADFVADLRAPTPSAAAEIITEAQHKVAERIDETTTRLHRACRYRLLQASSALRRIAMESMLVRTVDSLRRLEQRVDDCTARMGSAWARRCRAESATLQTLEARLGRQHAGARLSAVRERMTMLDAALIRAQSRQMERRQAQLTAVERQLGSLSPLGVLNRGYALVFDEQGRLVTAADTLARDAEITTRFARGSARSRIISLKKEEDATQ